MKIEVGDFVLVRDARKNKMARVSHIGENYTVVLEDQEKDTEARTVFEVDGEDVLVCFGDCAPLPGSVYGVEALAIFKFLDIKGLPRVSICREIEDEEEAIVVSELKRASGMLKRLRLNGEIHTFSIQLRERKGARSGFYKYTAAAEADILALTPKEIEDASFRPVLAHELGHHVWSRLLTPDQQSRWVKLYYNAVTRERIGHNSIMSMVSDFADSGLSISGYKKELEAEDRKLFAGIISTACKAANIKPNHIDIMTNAGGLPEDFWEGLETIALGDPQQLVTEYGKKAPEELFAEAFAFFTDSQLRGALPTKVMVATERTLSYAGGVDAWVVFKIPGYAEILQKADKFYESA